jgi:O-antigen/teichoic acid export membrane protein
VAVALEQVVLELLRARRLIVQYALFQLVQTGLTVLATVVLLPLGYGLVVLLQMVIAINLALVAAILLGLWWWNRPPAGAQGDAPGPGIRALMAFGLPVAVSGLGLWMMNVGDRLVVGHYLTPAALGRYTAVYTFASLLLALNAPLNLPLYPMLMNAVASKDSSALAGYVRRFHRYATLALVPAAVGLIAFINPVLAIVGGEGFRVSVLVIVFVVIAVFLDQWNAVAQYTLLCVDQVKFTRNAWIGFGLVNVLANIVMVPLLGLTGAGLVSLVTFLVLEVALFLKASTFYSLQRFYRFDVALKALASAVVAAAAASLVLRVAPLPAAAVVFAGIYGGLLLLFREVRISELRIQLRQSG